MVSTAPASYHQYALEALEARTLLSSYEVRLLGCLGEGAVLHDMNNSGRVVGEMRGRAFTWTPSGGVEFLPTLGGRRNAATVINDRGEIAGWSETADGAVHVFRYAKGAARDLGGFASGTRPVPTGMNESGQIVGSAWDERTLSYSAFLHDGERFVELARAGLASSISHDGTVFGYADAEDVRDSRLVTAQSLQTADLRFIAMAEDGTFFATGYEWPLQLFAVRDGVVVHDYGDLGQPRLSFRDIDAGGTVVGQAADVHRRNRGAFASVDGKLAFLGDLIPPDSGWERLTEAVAINDAGYVVGHGDFGTWGYNVPFLLVPSGAAGSLGPDPCGSLPKAALLDNGVLRVTGTDGPDEIDVRLVDVDGVPTDDPEEAAYYRVEYLRTTSPHEAGGMEVLGSDRFHVSVVRRVEIHGGKGVDRISVSPSSIGDSRSGAVRVRSVLSGGEGSDHLTGGLGRDTLSGGRGDDVLFGYGGADELRGHGGNDTLRGEDGGDRLIGGHGDDDLFGGRGRDVLVGGGGRDKLTGTDSADMIFGADDEDVWGVRRSLPP